MLKSSTKHQKLRWRKWAKSGESQHCPEPKFICLLSKSFRASGAFLIPEPHAGNLWECFFLSGAEDQLRSEEEISTSDLTVMRFIVCTSSLQTIRSEWFAERSGAKRGRCIRVCVCPCACASFRMCMNACICVTPASVWGHRAATSQRPISSYGLMTVYYV